MNSAVDSTIKASGFGTCRKVSMDNPSSDSSSKLILRDESITIAAEGGKTLERLSHTVNGVELVSANATGCVQRTTIWFQSKHLARAILGNQIALLKLVAQTSLECKVRSSTHVDRSNRDGAAVY